MQYYIERERGKNNTAGNKAPDDICEICRRKGMKALLFPYDFRIRNIYLNRVVQFLHNARLWNRYEKTLESGDVLIYQHPMYVSTRMNIYTLKRILKIKKKKKIKLTTVIHDLESLRGGVGIGSNKNMENNRIMDKALLRLSDKIICHNEQMKAVLVKMGKAPEDIVSLELFDYLYDGEIPDRDREPGLSVVVAGRLSYTKSAYIYKAAEANPGISFHFYGIDFDESRRSPNMEYHGSFSPEELLTKLEGSYGLVWDGPEITSCAGNTGNYLRYNNPHKVSMLTAAGIPVITWKEAAVAAFIEKNHIGVTVDSLENLEEQLSAVSAEEYAQMRKNIAAISPKVRNGEYFLSALSKT